MNIIRTILSLFAPALSLGGGSGGSSSTQQFTPPAWTTDYSALNPTNPQGAWQSYLSAANSLAQTPFQAYPGQTVADLNQSQIMGMDLATQRAVNGAPDLNAARGMVTATNQGQYLNNPWTSAASNVGQTQSGAFLNSNPWLSNQYTDAVIADNAANLTNAYRLGTAAQTDAAAARGGAYGGSAYNQLVSNNAAGLANSVGQMANQYQLARTGMGAQDYQSERGRMMDASQLGANAYQAERGNMLNSAQLAGSLSQDDWTAAQALTGVGDAQRQYTQDLMNAARDAYNQQLLWPQQQLDNFGNALARASGNVAGGSTGTSTQNYQASPLAALLGLGAAGYGAYQLAKAP